MHSFMSLDVKNETVLKLTQYLLKKFQYDIFRRNSGRGIPSNLSYQNNNNNNKSY